MIQKIVAGLFILAMVGAIVAGGIALIRQAGEERSTGGRGQAERQTIALQGQGRGNGQSTPNVEARPKQPERGSQTNRYGQGAGQRLNAQSDAVGVEWQTIVGTVRETVELVVETADGGTVQVGLGPSHYREAQGFSLDVGDRVSISGYWEEGEFKAAGVENLNTGDKIALRDVTGRPMWSGQGRRN